MRTLALVGIGGLVLAGACSSKDQPTSPPETGPGPVRNVVCAANTDWDALKARSDSVMTAGSLNAVTVRSKLDLLARLCGNPTPGAAQGQALDIVNFVVGRYKTGKLTPLVPPGSNPEQQTLDLVNDVLAAAVVGISYSALDNAWIVNPGDEPQTFVTDDGMASITVSGADVDSTTLITAEELPTSAEYLQTDLDQYPRYYRFNKSTLGGTPSFNNPVTVAICVLTPASLPDEVFERLRIGAQHANGFEVTPTAEPPSTLDCAAAATRRRAEAARAGGNAQIIGDDGSGFVERGSVGGLADNFSEFGVIDPEISARGSVGGLADNFRPGKDKTTAARVAAAVSDCTTLEAPWGSDIQAACRPTLTFRTVVGQTPLDGIPVTFTVLAGGGQIAVENPADHSCGAFSNTVTAYSAPGTGTARICWNLGGVGENQVGARAGQGGDASAGTYFVYSDGGAHDPADNGIVFTANALPVASGSSASGGTFAYDGLTHPGSGSCSPSSLTPMMSWEPGGNSAPVNAGTYTVTITCGDASHVTSTATAQLTITKGTSITSVSCPATATFTGSPLTPCTATVNGSGGFVSTTGISYSGNVQVGLASALAQFPGDVNHTGSTGSSTFNVVPAAPVVALSCHDVVYTGQPRTPCTATVTAPDGLNAVVTDIKYTNNTDAGTATVLATFPGDGGHVGATGSATFEIAPAPTTVSVSCSNATYNGSPVSGNCAAVATGAGGLSATVTAIAYANNRNAGNAVVTATYSGDANHKPGVGTGTFFIAQLPATATAGTATIDYGDSTTLPCTITGLLPQDATIIKCTTSVAFTLPGTYATIPVVSPAPNYAVTKVNGSLTVHPFVQVGCFAAPLSASVPPTVGPTVGATVTIRCHLQNPLGATVAHAQGSIEVRDAGNVQPIGVDPATLPVVFSASNAFALIGSDYEYGLSTATSAFTFGHWYHVTVRWNDGSVTTGWFFLND